MKKKMYTRSHNVELLKEIDHDGGRFTSEEHAYVMDKEFGELKEAGVKKIIDFDSSFIDWKKIIRYYLTPLTKNPLLRKVFCKPIRSYQGKFHGYSRSRSEKRNLYKNIRTILI